jgi:hypothetical protein
MPSSRTLYTAALIPSTDLGNATAETQFLNSNGKLLTLPLPSNNSLAQKRFIVKAAGRVKTTSNLTFTLNLYFGISATIASNTLIFTSAAQTVNSLSTNWMMNVELFWDVTSQRINGWGFGQVANSVLGPSGLVNPVTSADPNRDTSTTLNSGAAYGFTLTGLFSGSSAGNSSIVDIFDLESA